jgi:mono/diheme cytochrome c family protein
MKKLMGILGLVGFVVCVNTSAGEIVIKEQSLEWQDVAHLNGGVVFSNLCAACHGPGGQGDGRAAGALNRDVPNLTNLSAENDGVFPYARVKNAIIGKTRVAEHGAVDMPSWEEQFSNVRPSGSALIRKAYAHERIHLLTEYIQSLQG